MYVCITTSDWQANNLMPWPAWPVNRRRFISDYKIVAEATNVFHRRYRKWFRFISHYQRRHKIARLSHTADRLYCMDAKSGLSVHLIIIKWMLSGTMPSGKFFSDVGVKVFRVYFTTDQRKLLFLKEIRTCDNCIVRSLSILSTYEYGKILSKYSIHKPGSGTAEWKSSLWRHLSIHCFKCLPLSIFLYVTVLMIVCFYAVYI